MKRLYYGVIVVLLMSGCTKPVHIKITNHTDIPVSKVQAVELSALKLNNPSINSHFVVNDDQGNNIFSQPLDENSDGIADQLLVQVSLPPGASVQYELVIRDEPASDSLNKTTYCRFVPERMDDFAWENDKVAFRVYGPACQKLFEQGNPAGLISSGIDCWLKRVEYPIIDKWYQKGESGGSYHKDDGEGLDNFHVGLSRGNGGTAIRSRRDFIYSENYSSWEILVNGPLRSVFKLKYDPVSVNGEPVNETKTFTIDLGDNFYRCDVALESSSPIDTLAIGLTLHDNLGKTNSSSSGWISYWEPIQDSEIGMGAWVDQDAMLASQKIENTGKDLNHIWLYAALKDNKCTYYSGFGWKKSGQFASQESWEKYIQEQIIRLKTPLSVTVN